MFALGGTSIAENSLYDEGGAAYRQMLPEELWHKEQSKEEVKMDTQKFLEFAIKQVVEYFNQRVDTTNRAALKPEDVYVVWSCKTLGNNKALISTCVPDGMYYEITYNGEKREAYFDAYKKWENVCIKFPTE